jgi:hypothetical protein
MTCLLHPCKYREIVVVVVKKASPVTPVPELAIRRSAPFPVGSFFTRNEATISSTNSQNSKKISELSGSGDRLERNENHPQLEY